MSVPTDAPAVTGIPRLLLRLEGAALLLLSLLLFHRLGESWWLFAILFLAPDLSFAGYLGGARIGSIVYNAAHTTIAPAVLALLGLLLPAFVLVALAVIWFAHIGMDRMLGYGLKYGAGFGFTHLGLVGRLPPSPS